MILVNSEKTIERNVNIFGRGELYIQLCPLLDESLISISHVFDDTLDDVQFHIENHMDKRDTALFYCVGYKNMSGRYKRYLELRGLGFKMATYIAENAIVSAETVVGNGSIINQGAIIDNFVKISECVFVNIGAMISHHTEIKDNVFIAPGVTIAGYVTVNEGVFIGANSTIIDHINIGENAVVAAGAVVIEDVPPYTMVAGNPAKVKKQIVKL